ncbi:unnamed protein product [Ectocarpus fasciculatus]
MSPSTAAIVLYCAAAVSAFTAFPHVPRTRPVGASFGGPRASYGRSRCTSSMSVAREDATSDFDPLCLSGSDSSSSTNRRRRLLQPQVAAGGGGRRAAATSALHATKRGHQERGERGGVAPGAKAPRGRGRGGTPKKGALNAIKIGISGLDEVGPTATEEEQQHQHKHQPTKVAKGWDYWKYRALLVGVALLWGTNFPAVKFVEQHGEVSNATAAFVRFAIAAGASLPFADFRQKDVLLAGMEIGVWVALGYFTQAIGLETSDASVCAFLCSLTVVVVPLLDAVTGKGIKRVTVAASFLALIGTGFLELGDAHASWNDLWCVAQAVGFGVAFTRIEHYMEKFPGKSLQLSIGQLISVAALTGIWCTFSAGGHLPDFSFVKDPQILAALSYTGLVTTSLAIWLETICLEKVPAAEMSVIFSTEPLWATLVSVLFLKETMGPNALVGAGVILTACLVAQSEQISELVGMGGREGNDTLTGAQATGAEEGAEEPFQLQETEETEEVDDYDFPPSVLDEMVGVTEEADSESSFHMSMVQESTVPGGVYREGPAFAGKEGNLGNNENDIPAAAPVGWFESYGRTRS